MNTAQPGKTVSILAGSDLSATPYRFVDVNSSGLLALSGAGGRAAGVLTSKPNASGKPGAVTLDGIEMVEVGGSVTVGDSVKSDSVGRAVTAATGDLSLGVAMATGSSGYIPVLIGDKPVLVVGNEVVTSGALSLATRTSLISIDATKAYTLGSGLFDGQRKTIRCISATNTPAGTLTGVFDTDGTGTTGAAFNAAADQLELEWDTAISKWRVLQNTSVTLS